MKNNGEWKYFDGLSVEIQKLLQEGEIQIFKIKKDSFLAKAVRFRKGARKILAGNNLATNQKKGRRPEMPWQIIGMLSIIIS
jgi:hypothetical protein